jgi:spermidine synthase
MFESDFSNETGHATPFISSEANSISLHFTVSQLQSKMSTISPFELTVDYTQTMMGFAMLNRHPKHIGMIGLGGGSMAKFCYKHFPDSRITVAEINPHVIGLRKEFFIPDNDERFQIVQTDGAEFVQRSIGKFDVLVVDGFDQKGQSPQLCTQSFYSDTHDALTRDGILVVNLDETNGFYETYFSRIDTVFKSNVAEIQANDEGNVIVFAGRGRQIPAADLRNGIDSFYSDLMEWDASNV